MGMAVGVAALSPGERDTEPIELDELLREAVDRSYCDDPCPRDVDRPRASGSFDWPPLNGICAGLPS